MMEIFLENGFRKRMRLLTVLVSNNYSIDLTTAAEQLDVSQRTLLNLIKRLNDDLVNHALDATVGISAHQVVLTVQATFSLGRVRQFYVQSGVTYRMLDLAFTGQYTGLKDAASQFEVSVTSMYQRVDMLNEVLPEYHLSFDPSSDSPVRGPEEQVRLFMYRFYTEGNALSNWPFDEDIKEDSEQLTKRIVEGLSGSTPGLLEQRILLWAGIVLQRLDDGFSLQLPFQARLEDVLRQNYNFAEFNAAVNEDELLDDGDAMFLFAMVVTDPMCIAQANYLASHLSTGGNSRPVFERMSIDFVHFLNDQTEYPIHDDLFLRLYRQLLGINLRTVLFNEHSMIFVDPIEQSLLKEIMNYQFPQYPSLYEDFFEQYLSYQMYRMDRVFDAYLRVLISTFPRGFFFKTLRIKVFLNQNTNRQKEIETLLSALSPAPVEFTDGLTNDVDLIVVDGTMHTVITGNQPIFTILGSLYDVDVVKLRELLREVAQRRE